MVKNVMISHVLLLAMSTATITIYSTETPDAVTIELPATVSAQDSSMPHRERITYSPLEPSQQRPCNPRHWSPLTQKCIAAVVSASLAGTFYLAINVWNK